MSSTPTASRRSSACRPMATSATATGSDCRRPPSSEPRFEVGKVVPCVGSSCSLWSVHYRSRAAVPAADPRSGSAVGAASVAPTAATSPAMTPIPGRLPQCVTGELTVPGDLPAGDYTTQNFFGGQLTVTLPAGWSGFEDSTGELGLRSPTVGGADGAALLFWIDIYPRDRSSSEPVPGVEPTVAGAPRVAPGEPESRGPRGGPGDDRWPHGHGPRPRSGRRRDERRSWSAQPSSSRASGSSATPSGATASSARAARSISASSPPRRRGAARRTPCTR